MNDAARRRRQVLIVAAAAAAITAQYAAVLMSLEPDYEDSDDDKSDSAILEETEDGPGDESSVIISSTAERHSQRVTIEPSFPVAMHGLQSSLNRLNDVLNEAFKSEDQTAPQDAATIELTQAVKLLEERDDGLSQEEQLNMLALFMENPAAVSTYLAIKEDGPRRAWVKSVLLDANPLPSH